MSLTRFNRLRHLFRQHELLHNDVRAIVSLPLAAMAALWMALPAQASPRTSPIPYGPHTPVVSDAELKQVRGGVRINGVDFDFGAVVRVYVNGPLVAETTLTLNQDGSMSRQTTISDPSIATQLDGTVSQMANGGLNIALKNGSAGFVVSDGHGVSLAINQIDGGSTHAFLINTATGRQITQTVDAHLVINNFSQLHAAMMSDIANARAAAAAIPNTFLPK